MKRNILYIFDNKPSPQRLLSLITGEDITAFLLPIATDRQVVEQVEGYLGKFTKWDTSALDFATYFNRKAFEIKDDFVKFMADFPNEAIILNRNFKNYFKYPFNQFSVWWFSLLAEKNVAKSASFHRLVQLLTIKELSSQCGHPEIILDIGDDFLSGAIKDNSDSFGVSCSDLISRKRIRWPAAVIETMLSSLKYFWIISMRSIILRCYMPGRHKRKKAIETAKFVLVTYFPYLDDAKLKEGVFINKYYEPLQRVLRRKYPHAYAWLAMFISRGESSWREAIHLGRQVNKHGETLMFCEEWLSVFDMSVVLLMYAYFSMKYLFILSRIPPRFRFNNGGLKIWEIFKNDWHKSFCGSSLIEGLVYYRAFRKVNKSISGGAMLIYPAEMHCWEKALNIAVGHDKRHVKTVAVQHTIVPLLLLNYFNDKGDLREGDYIDTLPRPDYWVCVGDIPRDLLVNSGWDKRRVSSWGAMRFQRMKQWLQSDIPWQNRRNRVIVALSIIRDEAKELLSYVYQAFKDATDLEVLIKGHPFLPARDLVGEMGLVLKNPPFSVIEVALGDIFLDAKVLIVNESSVSLEALACGCALIIPRLVSVVDLNPLSGLSRLPIYSESPIALRTKTRELLRQESPPFTRAQSRDFILSYCRFSDSDEELLEKIENLSAGRDD